MTNTLNKIMHNGDEYMLPRQKALVITLTSAGWSNNEQTVTATGVTANNSIIVSPAPTYISDYTDAKIYCSAQGTDSLTFTCDSTPASDIEVNVLVLSAEAGSTPPTPGPQYSPDITTATQDQSVQPTYISNNRCIEVSSDGCHILLTHENGLVYEHTLSIPFDLTSTITSQTANLIVGTNTNCVVYSDDGSYIYVSDGYGSGQTAYITQRALSTPFDISTAGAVIKTSPGIPGTADHGIGGFRFYNNGTKIIGAYRSGYIVSATLSTAWDISTMGTITVQTIQGQYGNYGQGFAIGPTGMDCYMVSEYESDIAQLTTTNAYDFSNATKTTRSASLSGNKFGIKVTNDGKYCFIATQNGTIYRYSFQEL